ncbi:alpha/beta hydrolase [Sciscionella marina]|uniref:alpha/beta hydrolase n=1 Tax=Sciscionella marina TaxID=508770 RepID=UPI0003A7999D|nr:alpha/beta fold hydrolase [Sciscionella marina]
MPVLPGAEPFAHDGSTRTGVLLCHGFTGSPQTMRPWGEHLAAQGYTVRCPRLPGHGTTARECNRTRWPDWYGCVEGALDELLERCERVFVFGLSMGGTLTLRLAERRGADISGIVLVNPSVTTENKLAALLPVLSKVVPSKPGIGGDIARPGIPELSYRTTPLRALNSLRALWRLVRADLGRISMPVLLFRSSVDHVVEPINANIVANGVRSEDFTTVVLPDSFHVATLDYDASTIFRLGSEFVARLTEETPQLAGEPT